MTEGIVVARSFAAGLAEEVYSLPLLPEDGLLTALLTGDELVAPDALDRRAVEIERIFHNCELADEGVVTGSSPTG